MGTIIKIFFSIGGAIKTAAQTVWGIKALRIPLLTIAVLLVMGFVFKIWIGKHDAKIIANNNLEWQKRITQTTTIDTSYRDLILPSTTQSKPGIRSNDSISWGSIIHISEKDSLLSYYTEPVQAEFEDSLEYFKVFYRPIGFPPRLITLEATPKPQRIPVITINNQSTVVLPETPYDKFQWFNPRVHGDMFPFSDNGIMIGLSGSICSYGLSEKVSDMLFYFPSIGFATDMKKQLIGTIGMRWNIAHYIGFFQDTHLIAVYTTSGKILIGIGTTL
jgi:hypothetical protein